MKTVVNRRNDKRYVRLCFMNYNPKFFSNKNQTSRVKSVLLSGAKRRYHAYFELREERANHVCSTVNCSRCLHFYCKR